MRKKQHMKWHCIRKLVKTVAGKQPESEHAVKNAVARVDAAGPRGIATTRYENCGRRYGKDGGKYMINASNPVEVQLSAAVVGYWARMAAGVPGAAWPEIGTGRMMVFGDAAGEAAVSPARTAQLDFWDAQFAAAVKQRGGGESKGAPPPSRHPEAPWLE